MLTPAFTISQDEEFVTVVLKCPYVKAQEVEFFINETEFKFYVRPYFLRLTFPAPIVEDGREKASYNVDRGEITVLLPKANRGEHFPDLDLLTKLMAPKGGPTSNITSAAQDARPGLGKPLIEVVGESSPGEENNMEGADGEDLGGDEEGIDEDYHWDYPQEAPPQPELQTGAKYGFNNAYSGYGSHIQELAQEILDISDIETSTPASRREQRLAAEEIKFDEEYYMADFMNDEEVQRLIRFKPESWKALRRIQKARGAPDSSQSNTNERPILLISPELPKLELLSLDATTNESPISVASSATAVNEDPWLSFTESEQEQMRNLPNKEYLLDNERATYLGLVDIMYAYCYNHRTTEGDNTVESPWTVAKLSSTLSCFETYGTLRETLIACIRRSLAYPLYRHFSLSIRCIEDLAVLFKLGRRAILKALLEMKSLVGTDDRMYVLSRIYLEDNCIWIQKASDKMIQSLASELNHIRIFKSEIGWPLEELEQMAKEMPDEKM